ncbi:MAG: long-chain fatty acid--CoA ligase [Bacteroidetes bacterium 4572_77]|nr:MAG: long-chain fatty acid--CoA ligase [Bacteroidetes bacterium 4572_77]
MINQKFQNEIAIITAHNKITYKEFQTKVNQYSKLYSDKNYKKVAIFADNSPEWIYSFYSAWLNNCIAVPIDSMSSEKDIAYILNDCQPELIFTNKERQITLDKAIKLIDYELDIKIFSEVPLDDKIEEIREIEYDKYATAVIIYTSGTTGTPKGVMLSFNNILTNIDGVSNKIQIYKPRMEILVFLPLHHIFPLLGSMVAPLAVGGVIVMSSSMQASDILAILEQNNVNLIISVPRVYELFYKGIIAKINSSFVTKTLLKITQKIGNRQLSKKVFKKIHQKFGGNLKYMISGGAALNPEVGGFFHSIGFEVLEGFGMTEAAPMITFTRPENIVIGSVGQVLPGSEMAIKDGEIIAKGPQIMQGYYNREQETADVLKDGWLYTGDLGAIDAHGVLKITGRRKEIIIFPNGKNLNPVQLEEDLQLNYAYVKDVAVCLHDDLLTAIIQPNYDELKENNIENDYNYFKNEVISKMNENLTPYKKIMKIFLSEEDLPRTRIGKIKRFELPKLIDKKQVTTTTETTNYTNKEYVTLQSFIKDNFDREIFPNAHLEFDLGLDSLAKMTLIDYIEKAFGVEISFDKLLEFDVVRSLVDYIREHKTKYSQGNVDIRSIIKSAKPIDLSKSWKTNSLLKLLVQGIFKVYFRFTTKGTENIPEGPCLITPNHQSYLDFLFVTMFLKKNVLNDTYAFAKKEHLKNSLLNKIATGYNVVVMDLESNLKESIQSMSSILQQGKKVMIFPEGTRTRHGGLNDFKETFAILAETLKVPVVPVAISGAYEAAPTGRKLPKMFSKINVTFEKPIYNESYTSKEIVSKLRKTIERMLKH